MPVPDAKGLKLPLSRTSRLLFNTCSLPGGCGLYGISETGRLPIEPTVYGRSGRDTVWNPVRYTGSHEDGRGKRVMERERMYNGESTRTLSTGWIRYRNSFHSNCVSGMAVVACFLRGARRTSAGRSISRDC